MEANYVTAITELISTGTPVEEVLANLPKVLALHGHTRMHESVLRHVMLTLEQQHEDSVPVVTVASEAGETAQKAEIKAALAELGVASASHRTVVDDTIIGGFVATYNHKSIDESYRTQLQAIYQASLAK
jgi:F0F1-type ATP synthase delta subunit